MLVLLGKRIVSFWGCLLPGRYENVSFRECYSKNNIYTHPILLQFLTSSVAFWESKFKCHPCPTTRGWKKNIHGSPEPNNKHQIGLPEPTNIFSHQSSSPLVRSLGLTMPVLPLPLKISDNSSETCTTATWRKVEGWRHRRRGTWQLGTWELPRNRKPMVQDTHCTGLVHRDRLLMAFVWSPPPGAQQKTPIYNWQ